MGVSFNTLRGGCPVEGIFLYECLVGGVSCSAGVINGNIL